MRVVNRYFHRQYKPLEKYEAGISLTGAEVKSVKGGKINLKNAFVKIVGSEIYLVNAEIPIYQYARPQGYDPKRTRKLLLHKREIIKLKTKLRSRRRLTIVPTSCYNKGRLIKLEIALVQGRKDFERKKLEKKRIMERAIEREIKERLKMG